MKRALLISFLLLLAVPAFCTVPVTGNLKDISGSSVATLTYVRFELVNCVNPREIGSSVIINTAYNFKPNADGHISGTLIPISEIVCDNAAVPAYQLKRFSGSTQVGLAVTYCIDAAFNLNDPPAPCVVVPQANATVLRSFKWRGTWDASTAYNSYDVVYHNGGAWLATAGSTGSEPGVATGWDAFGGKGDKGDTGATGATGPTGPTGPQGTTANGTGVTSFDPFNTSAGSGALPNTATGSYNTAYGNQSLGTVTSGNQNTAVGYGAGSSITTHTGNTFVGQLAGTVGNYNTVLGNGAGNVGSNNSVFIGSGAFTYGTLDNVIVIGANAEATASNQTVIGNDSTTRTILKGTLNTALSTPASSSATCTAGDWAHDADYVYICTATDTWKRAALSTF